MFSAALNDPVTTPVNHDAASSAEVN